MTHYGRNKLGGLTDVTIGPNDEIIIVDYGNKCVIVLDNKFNLLKLIGQNGERGNRLVDPFCVAVTDNIIAVTDQGSHQVKKYSFQGDLLSVIGDHGYNNGQFQYPSGIAFSSNKLLYVADRVNCRVQVFQQDNTFAFTFGTRGSGPGQFLFAARIAIDLNNNVLVSDCNNNCIHLFSYDGHFINKIDSYHPFGIAISPTGYVIAGSSDGMITVWSPVHCLIQKFGKEGTQQGEFFDIRGVAIGSTGDIYIVEGYNKRLQIISNN